MMIKAHLPRFGNDTYSCVDLTVWQNDNPIDCTILMTRPEYLDCQLTIRAEGTVKIQSRLRGLKSSLNYVNVFLPEGKAAQ